AQSIKLLIKDAGRTLIQVIDDGSGMSELDARLSFERHATSKIQTAEDLFALRTMGFRGEALASIAAVAQVEMKTRRAEDELGVRIAIEGSEIKEQEPCAAPVGTSIAVKNLFFNIPARRNFLKSDGVEFRHILEEFERMALAHPECAFSLTHNATEVYRLEKAILRQRIVALYGSPYNQRLVPVQEDTDILRVEGFIGKPEFAKKTRGEQFFFLNTRFIKNGYLHHAVQSAFEQLLPSDSYPSYFLFLDVDPRTIDVNIHPTKTEVKFEDERAMYAIIRSAIKRALGQYNISPSLDFEQEMSIEIPYRPSDKPIQQPGITVDPTFNPFEPKVKSGTSVSSTPKEKVPANWQDLYQTYFNPQTTAESTTAQQQVMHSDLDEGTEERPAKNNSDPYQLHQRYILTHIKSGFLIIDQQRAHERILYERYVRVAEQHQAPSQQVLFPETIEFSMSDSGLMISLLDAINSLGFDVRPFGQQSFVVHGVPAGTEEYDAHRMLEGILETHKNSDQEIKLNVVDSMARALARQAAIKSGRALSIAEMRVLIDELFACSLPYHAPDGKPAVSTFGIDELDRRFKR
ncbi:MAG: DNA mismatch repair endonuclease MutL, partial [Bacteroidia bacterium]